MSDLTGGGPEHKIGEVAELTGLSIRTLRHYDEFGLVEPSAHTSGGFRLYTGADIERLLLIRRMKPLGFTLERMKDFLEAADAVRRDGAGAHEARATVESVREEAEQRYHDLRARLGYAEEFLRTVRQANTVSP